MRANWLCGRFCVQASSFENYIAEKAFTDRFVQQSRWKVSTRMNTDMVLDTLEQALHDRGMPKNVIHHSDRGVQYLSIRYTNRLEAANLRASVGTTGDSYDNALAETVNGLYKTEVIKYLKADWQGLADVQLATLNWVDQFNKKRVHSALGYVSPFEFEAMYYDKINPLGQVA